MFERLDHELRARGRARALRKRGTRRPLPAQTLDGAERTRAQAGGPAPHSHSVVETEFTVEAADGFRLAATRFEPRDEPVRRTILVYGATAVPRSYYAHYARFAAQAGARVITFDYRGIGGSRPESLRGFDATMAEWAMLDARAATLHALAQKEPLFLVGHSFGGQLLGLVDEARQARAMVQVGAQLGHTSHWPLASRPRLALFWHFLVPVMSELFGYLPKHAGLGVELPKGVARQWRRWCLSDGYLMSEFPEARERYAAFDRPTLAFSFTDDDFAPPEAVKALHRALVGAPLWGQAIDPASLGVRSIGHFGFFRPAVGGELWSKTVAFFDAAERGALGVAPTRDDAFITMEEIVADLQYGVR